MSLSIPGKTKLQTWLDHDLASGLAVFLVAVPLCLGLSLASGAPLYAGLLTGIVGATVVASISRSPLAISGPEAGLVGITVASIAALGSYSLFMTAVFAAGLCQILFGILRLGKWVERVPQSVLKGMIAGLGLILIGKEIPIVLGIKESIAWYRIPWTSISGSTLVLSGCCFVLYLIIKKINLPLKRIPISLWVILLGVGLSLILPAFNAVPKVEIPMNIFAAIEPPSLGPLMASFDVWQVGIPLAILASLEALLCVRVIDQKDPLGRTTPLNRELVAQGGGNMVCALLGALPLTAVIVRSSVNVESGARTRLSFLTEGVLLILTILFFPWALNYIPHATLGVILIFTGYNLTHPSIFKDQWQQGKHAWLPFAVTLVGVLGFSLLTGVIIGLAVATIVNFFRSESN